MAGAAAAALVMTLLAPRASAGVPAPAVDASVPPDAPRSATVPIAVLPFDNFGDPAAPVEPIRMTLRSELADRRVALLDGPTLASFMRRHRMRYTGGIGRDLGRALQVETGAMAVLVGSVDLYQERDPPKLALTCRLVSTGAAPRILWMESASATGDEAPGFLGLGRIEDPGRVRDMVTGRLAGSLGRFLAGADAGSPDVPRRARASRRFRPRVAYRLPESPTSGSRPVRVAMLPFADESSTRHAGDVVALQVLRALVRAGGVELIEPGLVREALLSARLIQDEGPSIPQADLLRSLLDVEVVLFGEVPEYTEAGAGAPEPRVDFSVRAIDTGRRQVIWSSMSHARGDEGVCFFDVGRVATAHALASAMADGLVGELLPALREPS